MRRTDLKRGKPPARNTALKSTGRLAPTSAKARRNMKARWELASEHVGAVCRIRTPVCPGAAEHFHELVGRAQGGSKVDPRNLVPCADVCNGWIEENPAVSQLKGWKVPGWQAMPGVGGLVPAQRSPLAIGSDDRRETA